MVDRISSGWMARQKCFHCQDIILRENTDKMTELKFSISWENKKDKLHQDKRKRWSICFITTLDIMAQACKTRTEEADAGWSLMLSGVSN